MKTSFLAKGFNPPEKAVLGDYLLVPLTTKDTVEDWLVITSNADVINKIRGEHSEKISRKAKDDSYVNEWPRNITLEENYKELAWLEICARNNQAFSYIIRSQKDNLYVGCLYIFPIEVFFPEKSSSFDIDFSFWIVQSEFDKGKYEKIFQDLLNWLAKDWPFRKERIFLRNKLIPEGIR